MLKYIMLFMFAAPLIVFGKIEYKMIDLGLLESDWSYASAINDKNQILGSVSYGGIEYIFIWEENTPIILIESLGNVHAHRLNNKGQFVAENWTVNENGYVYLWDPHFGYINTGLSRLIDINDEGDILGYKKEQNNENIYLWSRGSLTNISEKFFNEVLPVKYLNATSLNNKKEITLNIYVENKKIWKSFLLKNNEFLEIFPEYDYKRVEKLDDFGNYLVRIKKNENDFEKEYWVKPNIKPILIIGRVDKFINGKPICHSYTPYKEEIHINAQGDLFIKKGTDIYKLLQSENIFFNPSLKAEISNQNVQGTVVGGCDTLYFGRHAFMAIPQLNR